MTTFWGPGGRWFKDDETGDVFERWSLYERGRGYQARRRRALASRPDLARCAFGGPKCAGSIDLHHNNHNRVGHEQPGDFTGTCRYHHDLVERDNRKP